MMTRVVLIASVLLLVVACRKEPAAPAQPTAPAAADKLMAAWKGAGLAASELAVIAPAGYHAGACSRGSVQKVEALVCEYRDDASLDRGKQAIEAEWDQQGVKTGVTVKSGRTLLAVADRAKADPNGKLISKVVATFQKL